MSHGSSPNGSLDVQRWAFVADKCLFAVRLDAEADACAESAEAARLHATADQARALADIEIKLDQIRSARPASGGERTHPPARD